MSKKGSSKSTVFQMFDEIRGPLSTGDLKTAFTALVFLRWAAFEEAELEAIAAFEDVNYAPAGKPQFQWAEIDSPDLELRKTIDLLPNMVWKLRNSRNQLISNAAAFATPAIEKLCQLPNEISFRMVSWIAQVPFETPSDRLAVRDLMDGFLSNYSNKFAEDFSTPAEIATLMAGLVEPQPGEHIFDPCFGSAGLLTSALSNLKQNNSETLVA